MTRSEFIELALYGNTGSTTHVIWMAGRIYDALTAEGYCIVRQKDCTQPELCQQVCP